MSIIKAKEAVEKAREIKGSRVQFLSKVATYLRPEINKIQNDPMLSADGRIAKVKELKEQASKEFMKDVALRKQAYQHYLSNAKKLAKETVEKGFVSADDSTKAKFSRDFSELKFKIALKQDERGKFSEVKSFIEKIPNGQYATLAMESFYELAGQFQSGEHKLGLSKAFDQIKTEHTPPEVAEAYEIIEEVDGTINSRLFTMMVPGDNPAANVDYSIISELFTPDVVRTYQSPEVFFEKTGETMPVFVDPDEEKVEVKKAPVDTEYAEFMKKAEELQKKIQNFGVEKGADE